MDMYELLGVQKNIGKIELRQQYRTKAARTPPLGRKALNVAYKAIKENDHEKTLPLVYRVGYVLSKVQKSLQRKRNVSRTLQKICTREQYSLAKMINFVNQTNPITKDNREKISKFYQKSIDKKIKDAQGNLEEVTEALEGAYFALDHLATVNKRIVNQKKKTLNDPTNNIYNATKMAIESYLITVNVDQMVRRRRGIETRFDPITNTERKEVIKMQKETITRYSTFLDAVSKRITGKTNPNQKAQVKQTIRKELTQLLPNLLKENTYANELLEHFS